MADPAVVLRQRQPRWLRVFIATFAIVFLAVVATIILEGDPRRLIGGIPTAVLVLLGVGVLVRPPRIELREDVLVTRNLRTVRIRYEDIVSVRGDVASRLDWSTHLIVERRTGAPVKLPPVELPLPAVHDLIVARCAPGATAGGRA